MWPVNLLASPRVINPAALSGPIRASGISHFSLKFFCCGSTFHNMDSKQRGLDVNHPNSMRIREKTRFARNLVECFRNRHFLLRVDSRESAKCWCANRRPTKIQLVFLLITQLRLVKLLASPRLVQAKAGLPAGLGPGPIAS